MPALNHLVSVFIRNELISKRIVKIAVQQLMRRGAALIYDPSSPARVASSTEFKETRRRSGVLFRPPSMSHKEFRRVERDGYRG